jgi:hypothetical protein
LIWQLGKVIQIKIKSGLWLWLRLWLQMSYHARILPFIELDTILISFSASQTPFELNFLTDAWTFSEAKSAFKGFKLTFFETAC